MKLLSISISITAFVLFSPAVMPVEARIERFGDAQVVYDYAVTDRGLATLTLIALVDETNNSLRGLKNSDPRRLSKLGQLIYQCKLMLYKSDEQGDKQSTRDPFLISKNYSLFTGVNLSLASNERIGIQALALREVDEGSLFSASLGDPNSAQRVWESAADGGVTSLRQFDVNVLKETDLIETSEAIDLVVRFPVFQMEKPVSQWSYSFDLKDFKRAVRHTDENCTPGTLLQLVDRKT